MCTSCNEDPLKFREKWISILFHIKNKQTWEGHLKLKKYQHSVLTEEEKGKKACLEEDYKAYAALVAVVKKKSLLNKLEFLKNFFHAGNLEVFHSLCSKYYPFQLLLDDCKATTSNSGL